MSVLLLACACPDQYQRPDQYRAQISTRARSVPVQRSVPVHRDQDYELCATLRTTHTTARVRTRLRPV
eukprot:1339333-Rhodomonas_salina.1